MISFRSPLPVLTKKFDFQDMLVETLTDQTKYTDWADKIIYLDKSIVDKQRKLFDTSAMYVTPEESANQLLRVQEKLQIKGYHIAQRGILRSMICYLVNEEFQFLERLNEIFHWIQSAGLYELWQEQDDIAREKTIIQENIERLENEEKSSNVRHIEKLPMPTFVILGWIASTVLFVCEIIWYRYFKKIAGKFVSRMFCFTPNYYNRSENVFCRGLA